MFADGALVEIGTVAGNVDFVLLAGQLNVVHARSANLGRTPPLVSGNNRHAARGEDLDATVADSGRESLGELSLEVHPGNGWLEFEHRTLWGRLAACPSAGTLPACPALEVNLRAQLDLPRCAGDAVADP